MSKKNKPARTLHLFMYVPKDRQAHWPDTFPNYEICPEDLPNAILIHCPFCKGMMWVSEKKNVIMQYLAHTGLEFTMMCYGCALFDEKAKKMFKAGDTLQMIKV